MDKLFKLFQGRHTFFATAFFLSGNALHWYHRLDATWIAFMTALMGFVLGHSAQENYFNKPPSEPDAAPKG